MINPVFLTFPEEGKLFGEMVLGYGELDISFALLCGNAIKQKYQLLHAVNKVRSETGRLDIADAMASWAFQMLKVGKEYSYAHAAIRHCLKIRNQWAHCQWGDMAPHGLAFTRTDGDVFAAPLKPTEWRSITLDLLKEQEAYFEHTRLCILILDQNLPALLMKKPACLPMPPERRQPNMQNQWPKSARAHTGVLHRRQP